LAHTHFARLHSVCLCNCSFISGHS
jgi:hypothetical protein